MVKVDLITGFLGAGKTTFIEKYVHYLKSQGESIHIIENEFAEKGIDSSFLQKEEDDCCKISDLSGMCMCCIGKKEFIRLLIDSASEGCDRILVEPSGIYDVDEFFDVLSDPRVNQLCQIGSIITIVDPEARENLSEEVKYLTFTQLLASGSVLFSKSQLLAREEIALASNYINDLLKEKGCPMGIPGEVYTKDWDQLSDSDFEDISDSSYYRLVHDRELFQHSSVFQAEEFSLRSCRDKDSLLHTIQGLFKNPDYGQIYRIKGYAATLDGCFYLVNCTGQFISIEEVDSQQEGLVAIGQKLRPSKFIF